MDPVTASILVGMAVASITTGIIQNNKAVKARNAANKQQEQLRIDSVRAEIGAQDQQTNLALGNAASRRTAPMQPSFASAALTGNQSSNTSIASGSSGTF